MRITRNQLRQIIQESMDELGQDRDGDGVPDNQEGAMDPDQEVSLRLNKVRDLLSDAEEIASQAPDHQDKGEGFAMAELQMVVDDLHQMYGTEYWTQG